MPSDSSDKFENVQFASVKELANTIDRCRGYYSFLIGAGTSKSAGIPTTSELIQRWKKGRYEIEFPDVEEIDEAEVEAWAEDVEAQELSDQEGDYGFWFEKQYLTRRERRNFIRKLVKDKDPTFGHIVLASLMKEDVVPVTLTTNFDDLLYDAFYLFLEEKPLVIDHNAIAPEYQITRNRPTIIKLHGDYLYDNLKNTNSETSELEKNMEKAVDKTLNEYGMVVVGYGGSDESIMSIIKSDKVDIPDYGLFWCVLDKENLSDSVLELLEKPNTFLVEIDGFESLLSNLYQNLPDISVPMPHEIDQRANQRERMLIDSVSETEGAESLELRMSAQQYSENGDYDSAIELYSDLLEQLDQEDPDSDHQHIVVYNNRAMNYLRNGQTDEAIEDYQEVIRLTGKPYSYLNLAEAYLISGDPEEAIQNINEAQSQDEDPDPLIPLLLELIAKMQIGEGYDTELQSLRQDINNMEDIDMTWQFESLENRFEYMDLSDEELELIYDIIDEIKSA